MPKVTLDEKGRLTIPRNLRERHGGHYYVVDRHDGIKLVPIAEDPLAALRDEFSDSEKTVEELRAAGRSEKLDDKN